MKKRTVAVLLILVLLVAMTACGKPAETKEETKTEETKTEETKTEETKTEEPKTEAKEEEHHDHDHEHGAFEWIGEYELKAGTYLLHFGPSPDKTMDVGFVKLGDNIKDLEHHASHVMAAKDKEVIKQEGTFEAKPDFAYTLEMDPEHGHIHFTVKEDGKYALITEHFPSESKMQIFDADKKEILPLKEHKQEGHDHEHGEEGHEHKHGEEGHGHEHGSYEWIGQYEFKAGTYLFHFGECKDKTMDVGFVKMGENIKDLEHHASHVMATKDKEVIKQDGSFEAKPDFAYTLEMDPEHGHIHFTIKEDGKYAIITEHLPKESTMQIFDADKKEILPIEEKEVEGHKH